MKRQKTSRLQRGTAGFTLVEMIGVLAIIALLAGMLVPRIMQAIRDARVNSTAVSLNTLRAAVAQYMTKNNTLGTAGTSDYDSDLVEDGDLDKEFETKIGSAADVALVAGNVAANDTPARYNLDGSGSTDTSDASVIVEAVIEDVPARDAYALSLAIDGADLSQSTLTSADLSGRVVYAAPSSGLTDVYVYIAHE